MMAKCDKCLHGDVCFTVLDSMQCQHFKPRSRFVELPDVGDYDTTTTLDEAIDHCYQVATSTDESICTECKAEHMRLCGWLGDLKSRIVAEQALKEREENGN